MTNKQKKEMLHAEILQIFCKYGINFDDATTLVGMIVLFLSYKTIKERNKMLSGFDPRNK